MTDPGPGVTVAFIGRHAEPDVMVDDADQLATDSMALQGVEELLPSRSAAQGFASLQPALLGAPAAGAAVATGKR